MQAFLVSEQTIHDTVQLWALADRKPRSIETLNQIGRDLWSMNLESLRQCSGTACEVGWLPAFPVQRGRYWRTQLRAIVHSSE